jgi:beta-lactamase class A
MKNFLLLILLFAVTHITYSQKTDKKLQTKLEEAIKGFNGEIGIYVKNLRTGKTVAINADTVFPTASIVKVPILVGVMDKIEKGELKYDQELLFRDSLAYSSYDVVANLKDTAKILLKKVVMLMLTTSDNTASLWLQGLAGTGARINAILDSLGLKDTRVNSRTPGREAFRTKYGWGQTTPKEMGIIFEKIYRNELFSPLACDRMMRCLGRNYWDENEAISVIPPTIEVFSKNGCVNAVRSEALLVNAPNNPYILCVFTKNNKDISWAKTNEAWTLERKLSAMVWEYFEPKYHWNPPVSGK